MARLDTKVTKIKSKKQRHCVQNYFAISSLWPDIPNSSIRRGRQAISTSGLIFLIAPLDVQATPTKMTTLPNQMTICSLRWMPSSSFGQENLLDKYLNHQSFLQLKKESVLRWGQLFQKKTIRKLTRTTTGYSYKRMTIWRLSTIKA